jgi:hypothetical protein
VNLPIINTGPIPGYPGNTGSDTYLWISDQNRCMNELFTDHVYRKLLS